MPLKLGRLVREMEARQSSFLSSFGRPIWSGTFEGRGKSKPGDQLGKDGIEIDQQQQAHEVMAEAF